MKTKDYEKSWTDIPFMRPMYITTKDVTRGGNTYKKGTVVVGFDSRNTFIVPGVGNISLPLASVKFTGHGDATQIFKDTFKL